MSYGFLKRVERVEEAGGKSERTVQKEASGAACEPTCYGDRLNGLGNAYKIKLRSAGYRMVYRVVDEVLVVTVVAVGKRERGDVYKNADDRY